MIDLNLLKTRGIDAAGLKALFTKEENRQPTFERTVQGPRYPAPPADEPKKQEDETPNRINELRNRIRLRLQAGRDQNLASYQPFHAIDLAMDVPLRKAITPTMLQVLAERQFSSPDEIKDTFRGWGFDLDEVLVEIPDAKVDGKSQFKVSAPAFFQIFVPLVSAYKTIRQAKIMNDLLLTPFYEYEPAWESAKSRMQCAAITSRVEVMSTQLGYYSVEDQCVSNMLTYGKAFKFPREEWYSEEHEVTSAEDAAKDEKGNPIKDKQGRYYRIEKEGIRYEVPHPARTFIDPRYPTTTLNTDSGCEYCAYWCVRSYRDLILNKAYFNTDRVTIGNYQWVGNWSAFFSTVYPCQMAFPTLSTSQNDRETQLIDQVYTQDMGDKSVCITEYFEKLIPKDYGLGDYEYPVWFRFVIAADDTIIYAAPLPYSPGIFYQYDHDQNKVKNSSLALEVLPWQDHLSNLLTQYLITVKQNLSNVTFVDKDMVEEGDLSVLKNMREKLFRFRNFIPFSGRLFKARQQAVPTAFYSHSFPQLDANGIVQGMRMLLDMLERVLQMSSQELGQAASHEQTKAEVNRIATQTTTRLTYTETPVQIAREATKKQLYYGLMAYGEDSFFVQIPFETALTTEQLEGMGFYLEEAYFPTSSSARTRMVRVKNKKQALMLESFATIRPNDDRVQDRETAQMLLQVLPQLISGPLGPILGADQLVHLVNIVGRLSNWPRDFKLRAINTAVGPDEQAKAVQEQLMGMVQQIETKILGEVKSGLVPLLERQKKDEEALAHITAILEHAQAYRPPAQLPGTEAALPGSNGMAMPA